jgi:AcrR family transcriptional regulator
MICRVDAVVRYYRIEGQGVKNSYDDMSDSGQARRFVRHGWEREAIPVPEKRKKDRRIQKTEALLRGALGALIREKPYEDIVVKEILNRANVGRSAFYTHFADKDELLLSCIHDMLRPAQPGGWGRATAKPQEDIVWFSLPILEHIEGHRRIGQATMGPRGRWAVHEHLQHAIIELIENEVRTALRRRSHTARHASPDLLVSWLASTFVLVLNWWVESDSPLPAREADGLFRALIEPSLAEALR